MSVFSIGTRLRNLHTAREYTVCDVIIMDFGLTVYEVATDDMQLMRFNQDYVEHYEVVARD